MSPFSVTDAADHTLVDDCRHLQAMQGLMPCYSKCLGAPKSVRHIKTCGCLVMLRPALRGKEFIEGLQHG